jgi:hypothetical protein
VITGRLPTRSARRPPGARLPARPLRQDRGHGRTAGDGRCPAGPPGRGPEAIFAATCSAANAGHRADLTCTGRRLAAEHGELPPAHCGGDGPLRLRVSTAVRSRAITRPRSETGGRCSASTTTIAAPFLAGRTVRSSSPPTGRDAHVEPSQRVTPRRREQRHGQEQRVTCASRAPSGEPAQQVVQRDGELLSRRSTSSSPGVWRGRRGPAPRRLVADPPVGRARHGRRSVDAQAERSAAAP